MPGATPFTTPVVAPIVAVGVLLLVQVPPGLASPNVSVDPVHTVDGPLIGAGVGFTVIGKVVAHPAAV